MTRLEGPLPDPQPGIWIAGRLAQPGTVAGTVPGGFAAYARVFHPARAQLLGWRQDGPVTVESRSLRWEELAETRGTVAHPLMQWASVLAGYRNPVWNEPGWHYEDPLVGALPAGTLAEVSRVLACHTRTPGQCFAGLWDGYGWVAGSGQLQLPLRDYVVFAGDLAVFGEQGWQGRTGWDPIQSPNLLWPADAAWFLASEIDFDSTIIGGPAELIRDLQQAAGLEAMEVPPDGDLTHLGDELNETPD